MIIYRQKQFNQIDSDYFAHFYDDNGNLKPFDSEDEKRHFEMVKKKFPDVWERFEKSGFKGTRDPREKARVKAEQEAKKRASSQQSQSSTDSSSYDSYSGSGYNSGPRYYRNGDEVYTEAEYKKHLKKERKRTNTAWGISLGTWAADIANTRIRNDVKEKRINDIDDIIGHDKNMKRSDRSEIDTYKSKSKKSKENLRKVADSNLSEEEREKAAKKYIRREAWNRAADKAIKGANTGSSFGHLAGMGIELGKGFNGKTSFGKNELYGTLIGAGMGAGLGALGGGLKARNESKRLIKRLKNSKDKEEEIDKIKVSRGEMTETDFVKKHGGKNK